MNKSSGGMLGGLFILFCLVWNCSDTKRREKIAIWKSGYYEGYDDAREGIGENHIMFGPDEMPPKFSKSDDYIEPSKADYRRQYKAYLAGYQDFKMGEPYNDTPPE